MFFEFRVQWPLIGAFCYLALPRLSWTLLWQLLFAVGAFFLLVDLTQGYTLDCFYMIMRFLRTFWLALRVVSRALARHYILLGQLGIQLTQGYILKGYLMRRRFLRMFRFASHDALRVITHHCSRFSWVRRLVMI